MIEAIVLSSRSLDSLDLWQQAIDASGYGLQLNTPIPIESLDGYVPARWAKDAADRNLSKSGFECRHKPPALALSESGVDLPDAEYSCAFVLGWGEDPLAKITARIAAAAYAAAVSGIVVLKGKGHYFPDDVFQMVAADDKYEWLPRRRRLAANLQKMSGRYRYNDRPKTTIRCVGGVNLSDLSKAEYATLVGKNNSGKSFVLKALTEHWGKSASYLGPARYQNFNVLTHYTPVEGKQEQKWKQFTDQWSSDSQNLDNSPLSLQQAIAELSDDQRSKLKFIMKSLLDVDLEFSFTVPENDMSQKYVSCNGHNISFASSGLRLITTIITSLLDDAYDIVLVDEPELGISPEAQGVLSDFLTDRKLRNQYFPHIKSLILGSHSTVFLNRNNIRNNYVVEKAGDVISLRKIDNQRDFNRVHFFLLGNRFETLYLPSAIILVEGKSDHMFIERLLSVRYPNSRFSVIAANGDSEIKRYLHITTGLLNGIQRSPYQDRLFVVLDSQHSAGLAQEVVKMGVPESSVIRWSKNGIEYVYPEDLLDNIFGEGPDITINNDVVSRNGISLNKVELAERVCGLIRPETKMNAELQSQLLDKLDALRA